MTRARNLVGRRFGRLVARIAAAKRASNGNIIWECLCDCGRSAEVSGDNLMSGNTSSCGCANSDHMAALGRASLSDLTGRRFGLLVALRRDGLTPAGKVRWECLCDCGRTKTVIGNNLAKGATRSCGCRQGHHR